MEFVEAMRKVKKMCETYDEGRCSDCPLRDEYQGSCILRYSLHCNLYCNFEDFEKIDKIISEWKPPVDWSQVEVNTPIWVWDDSIDKRKRHFAKYENGFVYAWDGGSTSWNAEATVPWQYAELAEVEND